MTDEVVTISARFNGPPGSANGGYACGTAARALGKSSAEVTLRRPPPIDQPLRVERGDGQAARLVEGDQLVVEARAARLDGDPPPPAVSFAAAQDAAQRFDLAAYDAWHAFPACFTCGPRRAPGDGLRLFPAAAGDDLVAWPWVPAPGLAGDDGLVDDLMLWAALDCPGGMAWFHHHPPITAHVLGRMTATITRRPAPGEQLVAAGWAIGIDGRKRHSGAVVWGPDGEVLAESRTTWIELADDQRSLFKTAGSS
jgi:hypothetical protein